LNKELLFPLTDSTGTLKLRAGEEAFHGRRSCRSQRQSLVFASFYYYCSSLGDRIDDAERATYSRRGDRFWLVGYTLLFLDPSLILFSIGLLAVGSAWFALWLVFLLFVIRHFPRVQTARKSSYPEPSGRIR